MIRYSFKLILIVAIVAGFAFCLANASPALSSDSHHLSASFEATRTAYIPEYTFSGETPVRHIDDRVYVGLKENGPVFDYMYVAKSPLVKTDEWVVYIGEKRIEIVPSEYSLPGSDVDFLVDGVQTSWSTMSERYRAPFIDRGMLWIPLRRIYQVTGYNVHWDNHKKTALVMPGGAPGIVFDEQFESDICTINPRPVIIDLDGKFASSSQPFANAFDKLGNSDWAKIDIKDENSTVRLITSYNSSSVVDGKVSESRIAVEKYFEGRMEYKLSRTGLGGEANDLVLDMYRTYKFEEDDTFELRRLSYTWERERYSAVIWDTTINLSNLTLLPTRIQGLKYSMKPDRWNWDTPSSDHMPVKIFLGVLPDKFTDTNANRYIAGLRREWERRRGSSVNRVSFNTVAVKDNTFDIEDGKLFNRVASLSFLHRNPVKRLYLSSEAAFSKNVLSTLADEFNSTANTDSDEGHGVTFDLNISGTSGRSYSGIPAHIRLFRFSYKNLDDDFNSYGAYRNSGIEEMDADTRINLFNDSTHLSLGIRRKASANNTTEYLPLRLETTLRIPEFGKHKEKNGNGTFSRRDKQHKYLDISFESSKEKRSGLLDTTANRHEARIGYPGIASLGYQWIDFSGDSVLDSSASWDTFLKIKSLYLRRDGSGAPFQKRKRIETNLRYTNKRDIRRFVMANSGDISNSTYFTVSLRIRRNAELVNDAWSGPPTKPPTLRLGFTMKNPDSKTYKGNVFSLEIATPINTSFGEHVLMFKGDLTDYADDNKELQFEVSLDTKF